MVSIIIVDYNAGNLIKQCVESIEKEVTIEHEIIIVDNASQEEEQIMLKRLREAYGNVKVIFHNQNAGFAKANNLAVTHADGSVLHFLNPDTIVHDDINAVYDKASKQSDAVFATTLYEGNEIVSDGRIIQMVSCYIKHIFMQKTYRWYMGASLIMHRQTFAAIGGWPEDYFMYSEDMDLCYIAWKKGITVTRLPAHVEHLGGGVSNKTWTRIDTDVRKEIALIKFYKKYKCMYNYYFRKLIMFIKLAFSAPRRIFYCTRVMNKALKAYDGQEDYRQMME